MIESDPSAKQLEVNGALHGNISQLVNNRYYIDSSRSQIGVGTIVSFGSSIFSKPAPLTNQFIGEYLESQKIAQ